MSLPDDPASPAAPFSGDSTGEIFNAPDMVYNSPTTNEHIVDTQSGFSVVVRPLDGRKSMSVRRKVGTPPTSSILLTLDEALQLSRILTGGPRLPSAAEPVQPLVAQSRSERLASLASTNTQQNRGQLPAIKSASPWPIILTTAIAIGCALGYFARLTAEPTKPPAVKVVDRQERDNSRRIDTFVRGYVSDLLDFNADTYRTSQVRAMSRMQRDLADKYWQDTSFPLSRGQLQALGKSKLYLRRLTQKPAGPRITAVDVVGLLKHEGTRNSTAVHLEVAVSSNPDGSLTVVEQKDLTAGAPE